MSVIGRIGKWIEDIDKESSCTNKVGYNRESSANNACKAMKRKGVLGLEAYKCRHCPKWHIGHSLQHRLIKLEFQKF